MKTKYIVKDCNGWALQFTGAGKTVQVADSDADQFDTAKAAEDAIDGTEERQADVLPINVN